MSDDTTLMDSERLIEQFLALVHVDSPPTRERKVMLLLAPQLEALGFSVTFDQAGGAVGGDVGNLIATLSGNRPGARPIFFSAHVDTVAPTAGIRTIVADGVIRTDGSTILGADDKAAVAAIVEAVRHVVTYDLPHGELQILFSICEEIGLKGAAAMDYSLVAAEMGFVFDSGQPVSGVVIQSPTHDKIHAIVHGRKAHAGSAPEDGINAIQAAAAGIARMRLGRIDVETTANVGTIQGGEATNVIPDRVELLAEARSRDDRKLERQVSQMIGAIEEGAAEYGARVEVETTRHYSGFHLSDDDPVVRMACDAIRSLSMQPKLLPSGGGSDANVFNARGLPAVVLGVGYRNIHTHAESIAIEDLISTSRLVAALIETAAGS